MKNLNKILILLIIMLGVIYNITLVFNFEKKYTEEAELNAVVKVVSQETEKTNSSSYIIKILSSNIENTKNTKIILYTSKTEDLTYGDIVKISGDFTKGDTARNYKGFNYRCQDRKCPIFKGFQRFLN